MNESFKTRSYRFPVSPMKLLSPSIHIKSHQTDPLGSMFLTSLFCISFIPHSWHQAYGRHNLEWGAHDTLTPLLSLEHYADQPDGQLKQKRENDSTHIPETVAISVQ